MTPKSYAVAEMKMFAFGQWNKNIVVMRKIRCNLLF